MTKIKKTFKQLDQFDRVATAYLKRSGFYSEKEWTDKPVTKLVTAIKNVYKQIGKLRTEQLNEEITTAQINNALEDAVTKALLTDEGGGYKYSKEGMLKLRKDIEAIYSTEVDVHQRIVDISESDLDEDEIEAFEGILFEPKVDQA